MFIVLLVLTLILWFLRKNIYIKKIDVKILPKTTGTIVRIVLDNGITHYFVRFKKDGTEIEAETRSHDVIGRKLHVGEVITISYYTSSAGRISLIINGEGYELYGQNFEMKGKILEVLAIACGILTVVALLYKIVLLYN